MKTNHELWPRLPYSEWKDTYATLHMWTQIVGKIRLAQTSLVNHWWNVPLYVSARGLTTSAMPYKDGSFEIEFDFIKHQLHMRCNDGKEKDLALQPHSVSEFYWEVMRSLGELGIAVKIWPVPVEVPDPIPFEEDFKHASYDPDYANRFWHVLTQVNKVFEEFRSRFVGKCSPVHFFWGSFDLAVTRFSGRLAPEREGADSITREAYSHEVISHGFWPGGQTIDAAFYAYTAPEPTGFSEAVISPPEAFYSKEMKEFFLLYEDARLSESPQDTLLKFMQSTYERGANMAKWERPQLERTDIQ